MRSASNRRKMNTNIDFQAVRKEYEDAGIDQDSLPDAPMDFFRNWYQAAQEYQPAAWSEPNAMTLATSDLQGRVSCRIVLLKGITETGIQFFTNYDSDKGQQISANANVAVAFHWDYLGRQVRIEGVAEKTDRQVSETYFHSRPRGSQLSAAVSPQSQVVASREQLKQQAERLDQELNGKPVPLPENWGGYLIQPQRFEFWQGRPDRCHDRAVYRKAGDGWVRERIAP